MYLLFQETITGKYARKVLRSMSCGNFSVNSGSLKNPEIIDTLKTIISTWIQSKQIQNTVDTTETDTSCHTTSVSDIELRLIKIWKHVLHIDSVDVDATFFDLGGGSLKVITLRNLMKKSLKWI